MMNFFKNFKEYYFYTVSTPKVKEPFTVVFAFRDYLLCLFLVLPLMVLILHFTISNFLTYSPLELISIPYAFLILTLNAVIFASTYSLILFTVSKIRFIGSNEKVTLPSLFCRALRGMALLNTLVAVGFLTMLEGFFQVGSFNPVSFMSFKSFSMIMGVWLIVSLVTRRPLAFPLRSFVKGLSLSRIGMVIAKGVFSALLLLIIFHVEDCIAPRLTPSMWIDSVVNHQAFVKAYFNSPYYQKLHG